MGKKEEKEDKIFAQVEETGNSFKANYFPLSSPTPQAHFRPSSLHIPTLPSKSGKKKKKKKRMELEKLQNPLNKGLQGVVEGLLNPCIFQYQLHFLSCLK